MPTEDAFAEREYFDTPERAERLQLLIHLLNNAEDVPYLRAPPGAGKTRFAARLVEQVGDDFTLVWLNAGGGISLQQELAGELGFDATELNWPSDILNASEGSPLLVIVDDADALDLQAIGQLFELHDAGARLLLIGNGGLSQVQGDWDLQFVDLPPFSEQQSVDFIRASGGMQPGLLTEHTAAGLHRAADGWPGHLVNALNGLPPAQAPAEPLAAAHSARRVSLPLAAFGAALLVLVVLGLVYQEQINALFEPAAPELTQDELLQPAAPAEPEPDAAIAPIERPAAVAEPAREMAEAEPPESAPEAKAPVTSDVAPEAEQDQPQPAPVAGDTNEGPDPILDEVILAAIAAAEQPPAARDDPSAEGEPVGDESVVGESGVEAPAAQQELPAEAPAPAAAPPEPAPAAPAPPTPQATQGAPELAAAAAPHADAGLAWLKSQPPGNFTLQLVGAREQVAIDKFVRKHGISAPYAVFTRNLGGKPWYSLVAGSYPDRDAAVAARAALPASLGGSGVWPRTFASILEQMQD